MSYFRPWPKSMSSILSTPTSSPSFSECVMNVRFAFMSTRPVQIVIKKVRHAFRIRMPQPTLQLLWEGQIPCGAKIAICVKEWRYSNYFRHITRISDSLRTQ